MSRRRLCWPRCGAWCEPRAPTEKGKGGKPERTCAVKSKILYSLRLSPPTLSSLLLPLSLVLPRVFCRSVVLSPSLCSPLSLSISLSVSLSLSLSLSAFPYISRRADLSFLSLLCPPLFPFHFPLLSCHVDFLFSPLISLHFLAVSFCFLAFSARNKTRFSSVFAKKMSKYTEFSRCSAK